MRQSPFPGHILGRPHPIVTTLLGIIVSKLHQHIIPRFDLLHHFVPASLKPERFQSLARFCMVGHDNRQVKPTRELLSPGSRILSRLVGNRGIPYKEDRDRRIGRSHFNSTDTGPLSAEVQGQFVIPGGRQRLPGTGVPLPGVKFEFIPRRQRGMADIDQEGDCAELTLCSGNLLVHQTTVLSPKGSHGGT